MNHGGDSRGPPHSTLRDHQEHALRQAHARIATLEAEAAALREARAVLREVEWVKLKIGSPFCPCCLTHTSHAPDCRLAKVLG